MVIRDTNGNNFSNNLVNLTSNVIFINFTIDYKNCDFWVKMWFYGHNRLRDRN